MCQKNRVTSITILPHRKTWHLIECGIQTVTSNNMWDNIKSDKIYIKCGILIVSTNNMWHNIIKEWHNTGFLQYNTPSLKSYGIFIFTIRI